MFGMKAYKHLLQELAQKKLRPTTIWQSQPSYTKLIIRHDIDFSIEHALEMATIEHELGVSSTYFFMLTSNMYNLLSRSSQDMVREIQQMGHKISVHFDPIAHNMLNQFQSEKYLFEKLFNVNVDIVSIHRPGPFLENNNLLLSGIPTTYNDAFFNDMVYLSDSGGRDVTPSIQQYLNSPCKYGIQLLIHPIWWTATSDSATQTIDYWYREREAFIHSEIRQNCRSYKG